MQIKEPVQALDGEALQAEKRCKWTLSPAPSRTSVALIRLIQQMSSFTKAYNIRARGINLH